MRARIFVEVKNRKQAHAIARALEAPDVKAFAITMGTLAQLPDDRARGRVLQFLENWIHDPRHVQPIGIPVE